ncbi:hypothetical protein [Paludisphaera mucosa]|uniref:PEP-CTERM protein-sorting domain-containing protein n=1 Tax=Paludisphaera mucosa TaxID=3030827 RepID=A0ABT6F654_9BACT|nr:hypothetical protein [Paludisphaera mucosa]MDG3003068.1 hypothetical protein [Paludisphaera mucosa]
MDAVWGNSGSIVRRRCRLALATALLAWPVATAGAAPIRWTPRGRLAAQEISPAATTATPGAWASFLAAGPSTWASRPSPPYTTAVRLAVLRLINGDPTVAAASPLIEYLVWRRNLNVARFDAYHPYVGPRLPQGLIPPISQVVPPLTPPTNIPTAPVEPPLLPPVPNVVPPSVPEPSALVVIVAGAVGALEIRRRRETSQAR